MNSEDRNSAPIETMISWRMKKRRICLKVLKAQTDKKSPAAMNAARALLKGR